MTVVRAMSFNLRCDTAEDGGDAWPHRREHAASVVRFHGADVVGAQEALPGQYADLRESLPEFEWVGVDRRDGRVGGSGEHTPLGFRADRFDRRDHGTYWLSESPGVVGSVGWDAACPRTVTWARLADRETGREFAVCNTHFDHEGERARRESARLLRERLPEGPAVVTGDFNCTPDSAPFRALVADDLADAKAAATAPHHGPTNTFHRFTGEAVRRIDYVFVTGDVGVVRHGTVADHWDGRYPSDHFPVVADLRPGEAAE
ncbi:MAG: endonuclease/exonuclease/phosphatase family protein [Halobacteriaceae archaeon]